MITCTVKAASRSPVNQLASDRGERPTASARSPRATNPAYPATPSPARPSEVHESEIPSGIRFHSHWPGTPSGASRRATAIESRITSSSLEYQDQPESWSHQDDLSGLPPRRRGWLERPEHRVVASAGRAWFDRGSNAGQSGKPRIARRTTDERTDTQTDNARLPCLRRLAFAVP